MHCKSILARLLHLCIFLVALPLFSQCDCKNVTQKREKKTEQLKHGQDHTNPQPTPIPPAPLPLPNPTPPPVGPILQDLSAGDLKLMKNISYSVSGSTSFLVDNLQKIKDDPSQVDINVRDSHEEGATILHAAVRFAPIKTKEIVRDLVKVGADINASYDQGQTPLHLAIKRGLLERDSHAQYLLKTLLELGAAVDLPDGSGNTPLHLAAEPGRLAFLQGLLPKVTPAQLNQPNLHGHSPLHAAILNNNLEAVQALIDEGADMRLTDFHGKNALHLAAARGYAHIVQALLAAGADKTSKTSDGKTALELTQDAKTIVYLGGAAPQVTQVEDSLMKSIEAANYHFIARQLRHLDQDINSTDPTQDATTALQQAARLGNNEAVKRLLEHGADVNLSDANRQTALHKAVEGGHLAVVQTLLAHGAAIDLPDGNGYTPLFYTCSKNDKLEIAKVLVEYGADINYKTSNGDRLLHLVAESNNLRLLQYFLSKKALVNLRGCNTQTPLYIAAAKGYEQIVQALLQAGADANQLGMTSIGNRTLSVAINNKHLGVIRMLLKAGAQVREEDVNQAPTEEIKQLLQGTLP